MLPPRNPGVKPWDSLSTEEVQELLARPTSHTYYPGQEHLPSSAAPPINGRSFSITAPVERPDARAEGVLVAQGEFSGGYVFYVKDGKLVFDYNDLGKHTVLTSDREVPVGKSTLSYVFTTTAERKGKGALFINETAESPISGCWPSGQS